MFISWSFGRSSCNCVEAFAICGYAFPGFPHFTFVLVWKQIVNLYYSDCRALSVDTDSHIEMEQEQSRGMKTECLWLIIVEYFVCVAVFTKLLIWTRYIHCMFYSLLTWMCSLDSIISCGNLVMECILKGGTERNLKGQVVMLNFLASRRK